ncbi:hypothetical protein JQ615_39515 [Bradyrhizobium jicamae]|uniref:HTH crp-type domain-containing protein n=1 Tax=Bradyrhizobium jicamae TaxID=280332 RepID=A0ABS5FXB0_9BRAD|nr:hypothetical protein [Bradyrhizobium jicamae]MBR0938994.1 hypothetical protein [Bradyrhizobium jicamae]
MGQRLTAAGTSTLPMSRLDIADHLGLELEAGARVLIRLRSAHVLDFNCHAKSSSSTGCGW